MSDHLPECDTRHNGLLPCICEPLRACEERVWDEAYAAGFNHGRAHGELLACPLSYRHGLEAAREAVESLSHDIQCASVSSKFSSPCNCRYPEFIDAIDALKEDTNE